MNHIKRPLLPLAVFITLLFQACNSSGNVTVVEREPDTRPAESADTLENQQSYQELTLGLIDPVTNFDPLFADNLSTMRVLSLIYEGLYTLTPEGEPIPSLAREIDISDNGLEYTITIDRERFFHDSEIFSTGVGRRIHADDIKRAFERTATVNVPEMASKLLMNIVGYENYFLEQRNVYDEGKRVLEEVDGIQVESSNTIRFILKEQDDNFLRKLASPYLVLYPQEAMRNNNNLKQTPVGTGPYMLHTSAADNEIVLIHREPEENENAINQITAAYFETEGDLFQELASNRIDWVPETGPQTYQQVFSDNNNNEPRVSSSYQANLQSTEHNAYRITSLYLNRNQQSHSGLGWFVNQLGNVTEEDFSVRGNFQFRELGQSSESAEETTEPDSNYFVPFTENEVARTLLNDLNENVIEPGSSLVFYDIQIPTPSTILHTFTGDSFHNEWNPAPADYWLQVETSIISLYQSHLSGITPSSVPWLLNLDDVRLNKTETTTL